MKSTGIVRKLDELGRITLPIELRRSFDVNERDPLEIFVDDDQIILIKYNFKRVSLVFIKKIKSNTFSFSEILV